MTKENLIKFYQSYKLFIFPSMVALASLFLIIFAILPQTIKLFSNQKVAGELINKSNFLETKVEALESIDVEDLSRRLEAALSAYPGSRDYSIVIWVIQQIAAQSGFRVTSISLGNTANTQDGSQSYDLKLEVNGIKPNLPILLENLENSPRLLRVRTIDVSSANIQGEGFNVALVVEVLYSQVPKSFGSVDSPLPELTPADEDLIARLARSNISQSGLIPTPRGKPNPFE